VAALKCKLSPLVFAELYRLLLRQPREMSQSLDLRLSSLNYDLDNLAQWAEAYEANWGAQAVYVEANSDGEYALSEQHAELATWILAGLRNWGDSEALSYELDQVVDRRVVEAPNLANGGRPQSLRPSIRGWTLGAIIPTNAPGLPMVLALNPADEAIAEAYIGLVEHLAHLDQFLGANEAWPELVGSAVYVRTGGLAGALRPPPPPPPNLGLSWSIYKLMADSQRQISGTLLERLRKNWIRWVERRNVLTHVRLDEDDSTESFRSAAARVRTWNDVETTVLGITHFVCQEVAFELADPDTPLPISIMNDPWRRYLQRELEDSWWMNL
jgi:hypothetical protein